ncbi:MAG: hypothetical protein HXY34_10700 [Candidatus Thorarchaeota archaeon]|nr:hypothetical protein [Candidatus Thorarchaeota archaeon]
MTEAAETPVEDIEMLREKLRELKAKARQDLEELRRDRDKMREYKTLRDEHNKEVRALIESVKAEREERDRINKEIAEAKERRAAIHAQLKSVYDEIRELRSVIVGSPSTDQRRMMRRVEELEWRQQTELLTREDEASIVEEIAKIEATLVKIGQEKEKQDKIHELRRLARRLKDEATEVHQKVLELSEQSQTHHQEVVRIRPQLEQYKKAADTAHQNFVEWLKRVKEGEEKLKEARTQIEEIQGKIRKYASEKQTASRTEKRTQQKVAEQERLDAAVEKLQSGKRLTFDEFILAQRVVSDDSRRRPFRHEAADEDDGDTSESVEDAASTEEAETVEEAMTPSDEPSDDEGELDAELDTEPLQDGQDSTDS